MEIRLLGPVEVTVSGRPVPLGPPRQRAVLAMLALAAPETVSTDRFVDGLWGEEPPGNPLGALQVFVHGLRKALREATVDDVIRRQAPGYRLAVTAEQTDVGLAYDLHQRARDAQASGEHATAARHLAEARALWRGPALEDVRTTPFAAPEAVRLDQLRLLVEEDGFDTALALGEHAAIVDPLNRAVQDYPMRERFWGQLMTALYRSDRQAEALATYARAKERLADELGIDPGQALQQLELAILRQDPAISPPAPAAPTTIAARPPSRIPRPSTPTFGRDPLVDSVRTLLRRDDVRAVTLTGPGGSGKSRVAVLAALAVAAEFADGVVHLPLTERTESDQVLREIALALTGGDDPAGLDGFAADVLLVLDNLESVRGGAALVSDLVARTVGPTVLSTSRLPLRLRSEHDLAVPPLLVPGTDADPQECLTSPAVAMFIDRARAVAPAVAHEDRLDEIVELCRFLDGFPLAIELAAAQVQMMTPAEIQRAVDRDLGVLQARGLDVPDRQQTLAATIEWSYDRLDPHAQRMVDRLSMFDRSFTVEAVEAVCDDVPDVLGALNQVIEARLVRPAASRVEIRFVALGTVRAFSRARLGEHRDVDARWTALSAHLLARAVAWSADLDGPEGTAILGRYDDTAADLHAALDRARDAGDIDQAVSLVDALVDLWIASGRLSDGLRRTAGLLALDGLGDADRARLRMASGRLAYHLSDFPRTIDDCRAALDLTTDEHVRADARVHLGAALIVTGSAVEGAEHAEAALAAAERLGDYRTTVVALSILAIGCAVRGDFDAERDLYLRRLAVVGERGDVARVADTLNTLAEIALDDADATSARSYAEESIAIAGSALPLEARDATITLARAAAVAGDLATAGEHLLRAFAMAERTGQSLALAQCLRVGGCVATVMEAHDLAIRAFAAAQMVSPSPSGSDEPIERDFADRLRDARAALGEQAASREWTLGRTLPVTSTRTRVEGLLHRCVGH